MHEFIEQKKDMFLVELAHSTISEEIKNLKEHKERKANALKESKQNLHEDGVKLLDFIDRDQQKTTEMEKKAEEK